jgi:hypothetical protein
LDLLELNTVAQPFMSDELGHDVDMGLTGNCAGGHKMCINTWRIADDDLDIRTNYVL